MIDPEAILKLIETHLEDLESQQRRILESERRILETEINCQGRGKGKGKGKSKGRGGRFKEDLSVRRYKRQISSLIHKYTNLKKQVRDFSVKLQPVVEDVVNLMYFGSLFDDGTYGASLPRYARYVVSYNDAASKACLREDRHVIYPKYKRGLSDEDLVTISDLASLVTSPTIDTELSPKDALDASLIHANLWLSASENSFIGKEQEPQVNEGEQLGFPSHDCNFYPEIDEPEIYSYNLLRQKLYRIMLSSFFTSPLLTTRDPEKVDPPIVPFTSNAPFTSSISKTLQNLKGEDPNQNFVSELIQQFNFLFPRLPLSVKEKTEIHPHIDMEESILQLLLHLVFLGRMFERNRSNVIMLTKRMRSFERKRVCDITSLSEDDLSSISTLRGLVCSQPIVTVIPLIDRLKEHCLPHAKLWISDSCQTIESGSTYTYKRVKEILKQIMASDYFTTHFQPFQMRDANEVPTPRQMKQADEVRIWMRDANEVQKDEYVKFYKKTFKELVDPLAYTHFTIEEGEIEIRSVLYIPGIAPCNNEDLADSNMKVIHLYLNHEFICNDLEDGLFPKYLGFVKGVVDSNSYRQLEAMREMVATKTIDMIWEISKSGHKEDYKQFWKKFGKKFKLGCIYDTENHKRITPLLQFTSTKSEGKLISLDDYVETMDESQNTIYCLATDSLKNANTVPILEKLKHMHIEVLYLEGQTDEDTIQNLQTYNEKIFLNISKEDLGPGDEDEVKEVENKQDYSLVCYWIKQQLVDKVAKVQVSKRLSSSPCGLVSMKFGMLMKAQPLEDISSLELMKERKILEINPDHPIIKYLIDASKNAPESNEAKRAVDLLYDFALISNGELSPHTPTELSNCMCDMMVIAFGGMTRKSGGVHAAKQLDSAEEA